MNNPSPKAQIFNSVEDFYASFIEAFSVDKSLFSTRINSDPLRFSIQLDQEVFLLNKRTNMINFYIEATKINDTIVINPISRAGIEALKSLSAMKIDSLQFGKGSEERKVFIEKHTAGIIDKYISNIFSAVQANPSLVTPMQHVFSPQIHPLRYLDSTNGIWAEKGAIKSKILDQIHTAVFNNNAVTESKLAASLGTTESEISLVAREALKYLPTTTMGTEEFNAVISSLGKDEIEWSMGSVKLGNKSVRYAMAAITSFPTEVSSNVTMELIIEDTGVGAETRFSQFGVFPTARDYDADRRVISPLASRFKGQKGDNYKFLVQSLMKGNSAHRIYNVEKDASGKLQINLKPSLKRKFSAYFIKAWADYYKRTPYGDISVDILEDLVDPVGNELERALKMGTDIDSIGFRALQMVDKIAKNRGVQVPGVTNINGLHIPIKEITTDEIRLESGKIINRIQAIIDKAQASIEGASLTKAYTGRLGVFAYSIMEPMQGIRAAIAEGSSDTVQRFGGRKITDVLESIDLGKRLILQLTVQGKNINMGDLLSTFILGLESSPEQAANKIMDGITPAKFERLRYSLLGLVGKKDEDAYRQGILDYYKFLSMKADSGADHTTHEILNKTGKNNDPLLNAERLVTMLTNAMTLYEDDTQNLVSRNLFQSFFQQNSGSTVSPGISLLLDDLKDPSTFAQLYVQNELEDDKRFSRNLSKLFYFELSDDPANLTMNRSASIRLSKLLALVGIQDKKKLSEILEDLGDISPTMFKTYIGLLGIPNLGEYTESESVTKLIELHSKRVRYEMETLTTLFSKGGLFFNIDNVNATPEQKLFVAVKTMEQFQGALVVASSPGQLAKIGGIIPGIGDINKIEQAFLNAKKEPELKNISNLNQLFSVFSSHDTEAITGVFNAFNRTRGGEAVESIYNSIMEMGKYINGTRLHQWMTSSSMAIGDILELHVAKIQEQISSHGATAFVDDFLDNFLTKNSVVPKDRALSKATALAILTNITAIDEVTESTSFNTFSPHAQTFNRTFFKDFDVQQDRVQAVHDRLQKSIKTAVASAGDDINDRMDAIADKLAPILKEELFPEDEKMARFHANALAADIVEELDINGEITTKRISIKNKKLRLSAIQYTKEAAGRLFANYKTVGSSIVGDIRNLVSTDTPMSASQQKDAFKIIGETTNAFLGFLAGDISAGPNILGVANSMAVEGISGDRVSFENPAVELSSQIIKDVTVHFYGDQLTNVNPKSSELTALYGQVEPELSMLFPFTRANSILEFAHIIGLDSIFGVKYTENEIVKKLLAKTEQYKLIGNQLASSLTKNVNGTSTGPNVLKLIDVSNDFFWTPESDIPIGTKTIVVDAIHADAARQIVPSNVEIKYVNVLNNNIIDQITSTNVDHSDIVNLEGVMKARTRISQVLMDVLSSTSTISGTNSNISASLAMRSMLSAILFNEDEAVSHNGREILLSDIFGVPRAIDDTIGRMYVNTDQASALLMEMSEKLEGRMTHTLGAESATEYLTKMFNNDYGMGISLKKAGLFAIGGFIALNAIDWMSFQAGQDDRGKQATMMSITDQLVASKKDWTLGVNVISALDTPESSPGAWMRWREARVGSPAGEAISKLGPEAVSKHHPKTIWMVPGNSAYFDDNGVEYINEQMIPKRSPFSLNINIKENKIINGRTADVLWDREQLLGDY